MDNLTYSTNLAWRIARSPNILLATLNAHTRLPDAHASSAFRGEVRVPLAAQVIADQLGLTEDEREEMLPSGKQRLLHNRVHWAKFYMSKAGLIDSPKRGVFVVSPAGQALLATKPERIDVETLKTFPAFAEFYGQVGASAEPEQVAATVAAANSDATPEEQIDAAHAVMTAALKADLLQRVLEQSPAFFERLIVELLVAMGYGGSHDDAARQLGKSGDGGIDGVIDEDRLGLDRIYVQAKRYATGSAVGRPEVQGFVGSLVGLGAKKGVFVTTSAFSKQAMVYARSLQQRVILIAWSRLAGTPLEKVRCCFDHADLLRDGDRDPLVQRHAIFLGKPGSSFLDRCWELSVVSTFGADRGVD